MKLNVKTMFDLTNKANRICNTKLKAIYLGSVVSTKSQAGWPRKKKPPFWSGPSKVSQTPTVKYLWKSLLVK